MNQIPRPDSVRLAMPAEAWAIAQVQRAWLANRLPLASLLDSVTDGEASAAWERAILRPPLATFRVLVGLDANSSVIGFAAVGPSDDPDAEVSDALVAEFCIDPRVTDAGHDDRLMHAVIDTMKADGFTRATWWVLSDDDSTRQLLVESGWEPDGAHQEIGDEDDNLRLKQVRLHTSLV